MDKNMSFYLETLGSSSAGNSTVIWDKDYSFLIDCGFSTKYIREKLNVLNLDINLLNGIIITHAHSDHLSSSMLRTSIRLKIPIFIHEKVFDVLIENNDLIEEADKEDIINTFNDNDFQIGSFLIRNFEVPHDSDGGCYGFNIYKEINSIKKKISFATDMGYSYNGIYKYFVDSNAIVIEANHDVDMLMNSDRSPFLKQRIREIGHLSNNECSSFLIDVLNDSTIIPETILLTHLSQQCNTETIAKQTVMSALNSNNYKQIEIQTTHKRKPSKIITVNF